MVEFRGDLIKIRRGDYRGFGGLHKSQDDTYFLIVTNAYHKNQKRKAKREMSKSYN